MTRPNRHLGDGLYVNYTGYSVEISVNHHKNPPVAVLDHSSIDSMIEYLQEIKANPKLEKE